MSKTYYDGDSVARLTDKLNFNRGNVIKYTFRAGKKYPAKELEDLSKALWYLKREIQRVSDANTLSSNTNKGSEEIENAE